LFIGRELVKLAVRPRPAILRVLILTLLTGCAYLWGALCFFSALALGPVVEFLRH
jgi:K+-transporting ATPase A subunit